MNRIHLTAATCLLLSPLLFAGENSVVLRGQPVSERPALTVSEVVSNPEKYAKDSIVLEGVIGAACERKGCWMQLTGQKEGPGLRVTFKDYGFFIPLDARGMKARAEGFVSVKTLTKEDADHLESEGAKLSRSEDGTAREISFVASGVELRR